MKVAIGYVQTYVGLATGQLNRVSLCQQSATDVGIILQPISVNHVPNLTSASL